MKLTKEFIKKVIQEELQQEIGGHPSKMFKNTGLPNNFTLNLDEIDYDKVQYVLEIQQDVSTPGGVFDNYSRVVLKQLIIKDLDVTDSVNSEQILNLLNKE